MKVLGAPAPYPDYVLDELLLATIQRRPCLVWCDGQELAAVVGDDDDTPPEVLRAAATFIPELAA